MKNAIYCLIFIMISFCTCSTKNKFASILQQFVELNEAMGVEKVDVGVIIAQVKNTVNSGGKTFSHFFRTIETQCTSAKARLSSTINTAVQSINDATSNVNNWNKNIAAAVSDIKDAKANIKKGKSQLHSLRKTVDKITMDYKVYATEADKKLNIVKVLRDIITDELLNRTPGALVQVAKFQEKLNELKQLLNSNSDSLYSPMVSVLIDLATEQNFSDQAVLRKILQNLKNLDQALRNFRAKQERSLDSEIKSLRNQMRNVKSRIRTYYKMQAQANSKRIDASNYISFYNHEISHYSAEKNRIQDELTLFNKLCKFERKVGNEGKSSFNSMKNTVNVLFDRYQQLK